MPTLYCPECDYNLTGLPTNRCPECGQVFDLEKVGREMPRPITWAGLAFGVLWAPLAISAAGTLMWLFPYPMAGLSMALFVLVVMPALVFGPIHAMVVAERWAVTRALKAGGARSGVRDRTLITTCTVFFILVQVVLAVLGCFAGLVLAIALGYVD